MSLFLIMIVFLLKNIVTTCPVGCNECYYNQGKFDCKKCSLGFYSEENPGTEGYYNCQKCQTDNCISCKKTLKECITCIDSYYLNNDECYSCNSTCKTCSGLADNYQSCYDGYYLSDGQCVQCSSNCANCSYLDNCYNCKENYFLYEGYCYQCNMNCNSTADW